MALETPTTAVPDLKADSDSALVESERKDIDKVLQNIETAWNNHNLETVMSYYADDYMNNDGLDKKAISALTQDFWKNYPDAKSTSQTKQIRVEGPFATVESCDIAVGTTAKEMPGIGTKGELKSISEGQLYIRKHGNSWKIIGDRIDYEKVRVCFGLARQLKAIFAAPEQVKAGKKYSAKVELSLPVGLTAFGSITNTPLTYPQATEDETWRPMNEPSVDHPLLERVMEANNKNRNELLSATVGITNSAKNSLMGIAFLTRRLNIVPNMEEEKKPSSETASSGHTTAEAQH